MKSLNIYLGKDVHEEEPHHQHPGEFVIVLSNASHCGGVVGNVQYVHQGDAISNSDVF